MRNRGAHTRPAFPFTRRQRDLAFAYLLILPAFFTIAVVVLLPILRAILMSFLNYKLTERGNVYWNNFENYANIFQRNMAFVYLGNTLLYVCSVVAVQLLLALSVALLLNAPIRGRNLYRGLIMIPWTIPSVVTAILWSWLFQPQYGVVNYLLYQAGAIANPQLMWTQNPRLAMVSVVVAAVWRQTPYMMVMLLAGLQSVDAALLEAARIDGANAPRAFWHVTLPAIRPVLETSLFIALVSNSNMFTIIYNMTGGGPVQYTTTFAIAAYKKAFTEYDFGAGSAIGVIWLALLSAVTFIYRSRSEARRARDA